MVLSKKVRISRGGIHGNCWFAAEDISAGEIVWEYGDKVYADIDVPKSELNSWSKEKREKFLSLAYMISPDIYRGSDPSRLDSIPQEELDEYFVNHSCDGNCWYIGEDTLVASRFIAKGEEITYDYALTDVDPDRSFQCLCGKAECRKLVTGNDWKLKTLQKKYAGHFLPHVQRLIQLEKCKLKHKYLAAALVIAAAAIGIYSYYFSGKSNTTSTTTSTSVSKSSTSNVGNSNSSSRK